ncbi:MAG: DUF1501 domain-containing protein [Bacteroidia bacterium]
MNRRKFIKGVGKASLAAPLLVNGMPINVLGKSSFLSSFSCEEINDRAVVIIQLGGGNDGLNTLIPLDQYGLYRNVRPNVGIRDTGLRKYTQLDSTLPSSQQIGIQPDFMAMKGLYDEGKVNFIMDVCYPNPNKSHFKSTDIWWSGKDGTTASETGSGWVGRYLDKRYPNFPTAYPNTDIEDPFGIQMGTNTTTLGFFRDSGIPVGIPLGNNPIDFFDQVNTTGGTLPISAGSSHYAKELNFINNMELTANSYASRLATVYNQGSNSATYPDTYYAGTPGVTQNRLAPQLKTIARLLSGGSKTKVFLAYLGGFDHHGGQVTSSDPSKGVHATLLYHLSEAISAFQKDLQGLGLEDKILTLTFSEFGRTVPQNGSLGTDHGTSAPMMLIGKGIKPGVTGNNPNLSDTTNNNFNTFQHDYRSVFTTVLQDWLGANTNSLTAAELDTFEQNKLPLINDNYVDLATGKTLDFIADPACDTAVSFPVEFLGFDVNLTEDWEALCQWSTASEKDNQGFVVERSPDGNLFQPIGQVEAVGNSNEITQYSFIDSDPLDGRSYYRVKQIDLDGAFSYTEVESLVLDSNRAQVDCQFFPNPVVDRLQIKCNANTSIGTAKLRLSKMNGATLELKDVNISAGENLFSIQFGKYSPGIYFVEIFSYTQGAAVKHAWSRVVKQ